MISQDPRPTLEGRIVAIGTWQFRHDMELAGWVETGEAWRHPLMEGKNPTPMTDGDALEYYQKTGGETPPPF